LLTLRQRLKDPSIKGQRGSVDPHLGSLA
jgi:hypothetical protein